MTTSTRWAAARYLAWALRDMGRYAEARELDEDTLARRRRVLGDDHPDTLSSANNLAIDLRNLGEYQAARDLDEDTLARRRRVLGEDHPDTLTSANNLAIDLSNLGEYQAARDLDEDTLARYRRVLGEDHPDTLTSANNLAIDLRTWASIRRPATWTGHPGPLPPGARRGPPRHPDLGEQPRHRPARPGRGGRPF